MKKDYTDIIVVLDRSGSMSMIREDTIGGFNTFLQEQKDVPGEATLTLAQFDDVYEVVHDNLVIGEVPELDTKTFVPRGMTALYDAVGKTINSVGERYEKMSEEERPEHVVFVILTDGDENASREFKNDSIKSLITEQTDKYNWNFVFLGANQDACLTAQGMGISRDASMTYVPGAIGVTNTFNSTSKNVTMVRNGLVDTVTYSDTDRAAAVSK